MWNLLLVTVTQATVSWKEQEGVESTVGDNNTSYSQLQGAGVCVESTVGDSNTSYSQLEEAGVCVESTVGDSNTS